MPYHPTCRQRLFVLGWKFVCLFVYPVVRTDDALNNFDKTDRTSGPTDDLIRFWGSKVKHQGHGRSYRSNFVNTISHELLEQS